MVREKEISINDLAALGLLKEYRDELNQLINCMEEGDEYNPSAIDLDLLLQARDKLAAARAQEIF